MTNLERDVMELYREGCTGEEIADILDIEQRKVIRIINQIRREYLHRKTQKRGDSRPCPWSSSCFTCPRPDCEMLECESLLLNKLPTDSIHVSKQQAGE